MDGYEFGYRYISKPFYAFLHWCEKYLMLWGWIIFPAGLLSWWLQFPGHNIIALIAYICAAVLCLTLPIRFLSHMDAVKDSGQKVMFGMASLPFLAFMTLAVYWSQIHVYAPEWWPPVWLAAMAFISISLRWWYASGNAMNPKRKENNQPGALPD